MFEISTFSISFATGSSLRSFMNKRCFVAGEPAGAEPLKIKSPSSGEIAGTVSLVGRGEVEKAIAAAIQFRKTPSRYERSQILERARQKIEELRETFARLITTE